MSTKFINPEPVTIRGYTGPQEDPVISPDNQYLFFDSHNDAGLPEYIYIAGRIDYKTFQFIGRLQGITFEAIEAAADLSQNFYFISPLLLGAGGATTIGHGTLSNGTVSNVAPLQGLSPNDVPVGSQGVTFDLAITPDGNTLFFSDFVVQSDDWSNVQGAQLSIATKNDDGSFTRLSNSADILQNVNALGTLVYNAAPSADGLELAFNASPSFPIPSHIYIATRTSPVVPFGVPKLVDAADIDSSHFSEPGSFSPDETAPVLMPTLTDAITAIQFYVAQVLAAQASFTSASVEINTSQNICLNAAANAGSSANSAAVSSSGAGITTTVALLPAGTEGIRAFATNGRKIGEGPGSGSGVPVYYSTGAWRVISTDAAVTA